MYRCKECGAEYEEKPDYCDCGNDEFEGVNVSEAKVGVNVNENSDNSIESVILSEPKESAISSNKISYEEKTTENHIQEKAKILSASDMKFSNQTNASYVPKRTLVVDPISLIIFVVCLFLSIYILLFAWNDVKVKNTEVKNDTTAVNQNLPSIDNIWNNALPTVKKEELKKEETNIVKQIIQVPTVKKVEPTKTVQKTKTSVNNTKTAQTKNTAQKKTTSAKTATTVKQQTNTNAQEKAKKAAEAAAKQKAEQERKAAEAAQLKKLQAEQAKKAAEEKAKQAAAAKQELINYKAQLRNTIGRKIDFTKVIGDGSCTIAFKIDSNGRLTNRSFAKQSSNNTLNDAVYAAVMATPSFTPPPSRYNNETLNLNIRFSNGNFEISLP